MRYASRRAADAALLRLAAIVEKSRRYDQGRVRHRCGTPACLLGHAVVGSCASSAEEESSMVFRRFAIADDVQYYSIFGATGCDDAGRSGKKAAKFVRAFVAMRKAGLIPYNQNAR